MKQINRTKQESHQLSVTTLPNIDNTIGSDTETALDQNLCSTSQYWVRKTGACSYSCENVSMKFLDWAWQRRDSLEKKKKRISQKCTVFLSLRWHQAFQFFKPVLHNIKFRWVG